MFDPEKVGRFYDVECCGNPSMSDAQSAPPNAEIYVMASDYDQLLERCRQLEDQLSAYKIIGKAHEETPELDFSMGEPSR